MADDSVALTSVESFLMREQTVFAIEGVPRLDPRALLHRVIVLDGRTVRVVGVETYAILDATGTSFVVQVEPVTA